MKPSQLVQLLLAAISARHSVLIVGGPGIAKTSVVDQTVQQLGAGMVTEHPALNDPTDAKGFPWMQPGDKTATFVPFGNLAEVLAATGLTVWFWDDLGQAPPAVQTSYMPWLLARAQGGRKLPDDVVIIAATNRRTDRAGVAGVLEPVKSRFTTIVELEPDLDEWCQWAMTGGKKDIPPELIAFLRFRSGDNFLNKFEPTADLKNSPTPRTWHNAGKILNLQLSTSVEAAALAGAVGEGASTELLAYVRMFRELPNIDAILVDADSVDIPTAPNVLYAVTTALASRANDRNVKRVFRYGERLVEKGKGEFASLLVRDVLRRSPELQQTTAFVNLMAGELGQLVGGGAAASGRRK